MTTDTIRTIPDLQSFLHSYSIKHPGEDGKPFTTRCQTIVNGWKVLETAADADQIAEVKRNMAKAARQLADLDPAMEWLPTWKPRVAVEAKGG
jgi:hypothetical protein